MNEKAMAISGSIRISIMVLVSFLLVNLLLKGVLSGTVVFVAVALVWFFCVSVVLFFLRRQQIKLLVHKMELTRLALILGFSIILLLIFFGLFSGFAINQTPSSLLFLVPMVVANLLAVELARLYLLRSVPKSDSFNFVLLISLFCTFMSLSYFGEFSGSGILVFVAEAFLPLLVINLLATNFTFHSGFPSAFVFVALPAFFFWFSPVLPNMTWIVKPLISFAVVGMGYLILEETVATEGQVYRSRFMKRKSVRFSWLIVGLVVLIAVWSASGLFGFKPTVIVSGSMSPAFQVGDMPVVSPVDASSIVVGDVIQFTKGDVTVVHRVVEIQAFQGVFWFVTKGDANDGVDSGLVGESEIVGRVVFNIPKIGLISLGLGEATSSGRCGFRTIPPGARRVT